MVKIYVCPCLNYIKSRILKEEGARIITNSIFITKDMDFESVPTLYIKKITKQGEKKYDVLLPNYCPICGKKVEEV